MKIHQLKRKHSRPKRKPQLGRGGSRGHKSGHGDKGQKARSGGSRGRRRGFEGGRKSFVRRTHKLRGAGARKMRRGFINIGEISIGDLDHKFSDGAIINLAALRKSGLVELKQTGAKILSGGKTVKKFIIEGLPISAKAKEVLEKSGSTIK